MASFTFILGLLGAISYSISYPCGPCECLFEVLNCREAELTRLPAFTWETTRKTTILDLSKNDGISVDATDFEHFPNLEIIRIGMYTYAL